MGLQISRILHAGYVFQGNESTIVFDPILENPFSKNCHAFPGIVFDPLLISQQKFSAVFISHYHDDHCSLDSLVKIDRETPLYLYCIFDEVFDWLRQLGFQFVHPMQLGKTVQVGEFQVTARPALDRDTDCLFQITGQGLQILNVVDSWIDPEELRELAKLAPWDLVLWPFQTMRELEVLSPRTATPATGLIPEEWNQQLKALNPRFLVPSSCQFQLEPWSWYNRAYFPISYSGFREQMSRLLPTTKVLRMDPASRWVFDGQTLQATTGLSWMKPAPPVGIDYIYEPEAPVDPTGEVAKRFPELLESETQRVFHYCRQEIIQRYQSLELSTEPFFQKQLLWKLMLYDHSGQSFDFLYDIRGNKMVPVQNHSDKPVDWQTEIPMFKLYQALEDGESLSSLYLRINDRKLDPIQIRVLKDVDTVEDPLIRSLYSGVFGAYQKAQLKRLMGSY